MPDFTFASLVPVSHQFFNGSTIASSMPNKCPIKLEIQTLTDGPGFTTECFTFDGTSGAMSFNNRYCGETQLIIMALDTTLNDSVMV